MFSIFANHSQNIPVGSLTLVDLYNQLVSPDRDPFIETINMIQRLRDAPDEATQKHIKGCLPAFTPGAMMDTKRSDSSPEQKNIRPSGFMQIDVDLQDNPNMTNASETRDKLSQMPYIALSAISARGRGVWGLIALQEPHNFIQYADQVYQYFKGARVTIDRSKSKNLTELRYFAPDPGAILNAKYELMPLIPVKVKAKQRTQHSNTPPTGTSLSDLEKWVIETTGYRFEDGQKHYYILWLSYALKKNGSTDQDVYNTIYSIMSQDKIHSNCIESGISNANDKGVYVPIERSSVSRITSRSIRTKISSPNKRLIPIAEREEIRRDVVGSDGLIHIHRPGIG